MANTHSTNLVAASNQYWSITDASQAGLDITGALTIALWVRFASTTPNATIWGIVSKANFSTDQAYLFAYRDDGTPRGLYYRLSSGGDNTSTSSGLASWEPTNDVWYHIAMVFDPSLSSGSRVQFYVDGSTQGSAMTGPASIHNSDAEFRVGYDTGLGVHFDGDIDDVRIWSRALSSTEIGDLHDDSCNFDNGANLQGHWKFDNDGSDETANNNTLTNNNTATFTTDVPFVCADAGGGVIVAPTLLTLGVG